MRISSSLLLLLLLPATLHAEPPAPMADRVKILTVEMNRGPAEDLAPFLTPEAHTLSRQYAIRALGRIGDRGMAPEMLAELLATEKEQLALVLWAAGIAKAKKLAGAIGKHLASEDPIVAAAAAKALGWSEADGAAATLSGMLLDPRPTVQAAALRGLARLAPEMLLERVIWFLRNPDAEVRKAAGFAVWRIALARQSAAKARVPEWKGDSAAGFNLLRAVGNAPVEQELLLLRAAGAVLPPTIERDTLLWPSEQFFPGDPRVVQEMIRWVYTGRNCPDVNFELALYLDHRDEKIRQLAAEALGKHGQIKPLLERLEVEKDLRLRDILAVEIARCGDRSAWDRIAKDPAREQMEEVFRLGTHASVLLALADEDSIGELIAWSTPTAKRRPPPGVLVRTLWELGGKGHPKTGPFLRTLVIGPAAYNDEHVIAATVYLAKESSDREFIEMMLATPDPLPEVRRAIASVLGEYAGDEKCPKKLRETARKWLASAMTDAESSTFVRLAARESALTLGMEVPALDDLPASEWKGLPRPKGSVLGLEFPGDSAWLTELEILTLADRIEETGARIEFETTAGSILVELYPDHAPVHCASVVLLAASGAYRNTRWHRVVPSFVIQGGDPHGHGAGDAGYFLPDEIGPLIFDRGALGMPKSRKDDGGCQLFFMHSAYPRLDGNYTLYGRVVGGMAAVDEIRVGDVILDAKVVAR